MDSEAAAAFVSMDGGSGRELRGALAGGFVEEDGGGRGGVQRFDGRRHRDANAGVGRALNFFGEPLAFVADKQGNGAAPVDLPGSEERLIVSSRFLGTSGHYVYACGAQLFDGRYRGLPD